MRETLIPGEVAEGAQVFEAQTVAPAASTEVFSGQVDVDAAELTAVRADLAAVSSATPAVPLHEMDSEELARMIGLQPVKGVNQNIHQARVYRAIRRLDRVFPEYNLHERLLDMYGRVVVVTQSSLMDFAQKAGIETDSNGKQHRTMIPIDIGGVSFAPTIRLIAVNGRKNFAERVVIKHHELLHIATQGLLRGRLSQPLIEGATQYYTREAIATESIINRVRGVDQLQNYPSGVMTFALMAGATGTQVAKDAYFNGEIGNFSASLDARWGQGAFKRINFLSRVSPVFGLGYALAKTVTGGRAFRKK